MKKYIYLKEGEIITPDVELHDPEGKFWEGNDYTDTPVSKNWVGHFRRPVPHTGDVQFLMYVSILVPVIVNCDGLAQDEIEMIAGDAVIRKIKGDVDSYVCHENIDWPACKVDEIQPEPKNKYRYLKVGEKIQEGDEKKGTSRSDWFTVDASIGGVVGSDAYPRFRRPITEPQSIPTLKNIQAEGRATRPLYEGYPPSIEYIEI